MYATDEYHIQHKIWENFMEITYYERGISTCQFVDGSQREFPPESIGIHLFKLPARFISKESHRHYTMGFHLEYDFVHEATDGAVHLEYCVSDIEFVSEAARIIRACVRDYLLYDNNSCKTTARIFELFALYQHRYAERTLCPPKVGIAAGALRYVKQAKEYILLNIGGKFSVSDIANALGLSRGYLSNIFKAASGISIVRYINEMRLEMVKNLCLNESASLSEACALVGLDDPNYISRMFRKYYDTTLTNIKASGAISENNKRSD